VPDTAAPIQEELELCLAGPVVNGEMAERVGFLNPPLTPKTTPGSARLT
jgi:hypothetical protein